MNLKYYQTKQLLSKKYENLKKNDQKIQVFSISNKKRTSAEKLMAKLLKESKIEFEEQFCIPFGSTYKLFDFKITGKDILLEVDGDYWHGNLDNEKISINYMHLKNKKNDFLKNIIAKKKGFKLIRVWETDLQNNYDEVKAMILKECV